MEQSTEEPLSPFDHYERGRQLKQVPMYDKALEAFQQAAKDPRYAGKAHVQMALCFRSMARYDEAVAAFHHAMVVDTFSSKELAHILYLQGQTLESLGRYAEALEAYGWARKEDPSIQDVTPRIKHLLAGGRGPLPPRRPASQSVVGGLLSLGRQLTPHVLGLLGQASKSLSEYADRPGTAGGSRHQSPSVRDMGHQHGQRELTLTRYSPSALRDRKKDKRQHVRVAVRARGHFSSKGRMVDGEGELRDLSPGGCRVTSPVAVPVGAELECCIVPQDAVNPFTVEGATVRWSRAQEFGLAFTKVRPGVQRQIAQLCGRQTPFGVEV